ncbi:uncharacterized protein LOC144287987 isoform X2 [Canis aureus]
MPRGAKGSLGAVVPLDAYRYCQRGSGGSLGSVQPGSVRRAEAEKRARNWKRATTDLLRLSPQEAHQLPDHSWPQCHGNQDRKASWPPKPDLKSKLDARNMISISLLTLPSSFCMLHVFVLFF